MWLGIALLVSFLRRETRRRFLAGSVVDHVASNQTNEVSFRRKERVFRVADGRFAFSTRVASLLSGRLIFSAALALLRTGKMGSS